MNRSQEFGEINVWGDQVNYFELRGTNAGSIFNIYNLNAGMFTIRDFVNVGELNFFGINPNRSQDRETFFDVINSDLNKAKFFDVDFKAFDELSIAKSSIVDCSFIRCLWTDNIRSHFGRHLSGIKTKEIHNFEYQHIREAYRQLKISMNKHSDRIQEQIFYSQEMKIYNKLLKWSPVWKNQFWDKLILYFSSIFSDFGQSFIRPLFWLILGHLLLFMLAMAFNGFSPLHFSLNHPTEHAFKYSFQLYFLYINPFRNLETTLPGYLIVLDLIMRIWSSYMIFNIIRASRRFIS